MQFHRNQFVEILYSGNESEAVKTALLNLKSDLYKVLETRTCLHDITKETPKVFGVQNGPCSLPDSARFPNEYPVAKIIVATSENLSSLISSLSKGIEEMDSSTLSHLQSQIPMKKEGYALAVIHNCLFLCGNDRRGTIYAIYEFCERLGVSPWYFFADVPVKRKTCFTMEENEIYTDYPSVEYRGIFINDEEELEKWVACYMSEETIGPKTYAHIFELLLRLKCNYIWPAMHVNSFNANVANGELAEKMGIVVGTSHCDMLMRSNNREWEPWKKQKGYHDLSYDFSIPGENREKLIEYWRESVEQNKDFEVTYTLGMRGIHDSGFNTDAFKNLSGKALLQAKIDLLAQVFKAQDQILSEIPHKQSLKLFVPYKEVLELYDNGLPVPEDYTLIWTNDNYGHVRRYPDSEARRRVGGNGIYYHQSYWASPAASYLFINSIPAAQTRNELLKAYENGIQKLWVTNFGAIKPLEQQLTFYAALAWNIGKETDPTKDVVNFLAKWIDKTFSGEHGSYLAPLLTEFDQVVNMRKIELLDNQAFYQSEKQDDAIGRICFLHHVFTEANVIYDSLPGIEKDAFFELILFRIHAAYYANACYYYADRSLLLSGLGNDSEADQCFALSSQYDYAKRCMLHYYNHVLCGGKWNGIVTPEDFPPPRTAMYPAAMSFSHLHEQYGDCVKSLSFSDHIRPLVVNDVCKRVTIEGIDCLESLTDLKDVKRIPHLGRGYGDLVEFESATGSLTYQFDLPKEASYTFTLERFPSLNSVGEIGVDFYLDGEKKGRLLSDANDEHRGSWHENVLNDRDVLSLPLGILKSGTHTIRFSNASTYFAFSRFHIHDLSDMGNHFWRKENGQSLLSHKTLITPDFAKIISTYYGSVEPDERPELLLPVGFGGNSLADEDCKLLLSKETDTPFTGKNCISLSLLDAYLPASDAHIVGSSPDFCFGVGRKNLSLYCREQGPLFEGEHGVSYKVEVSSGTYNVWLCLYTKGNAEYLFDLKIDDTSVLPAGKDTHHLWRYASENVYKWIPIATPVLESGKHTVTFLFGHTNLRLEGIVLEKLS